jgi:hypothetical protein
LTEANKGAYSAIEANNIVMEKFGKIVHDIQSDGIGSLPDAIDRTTSALARLDDKFSRTIKGLQDMTAEAERLYNYYGKTGGNELAKQLEYTILKDLQLLKTLPKNSQAYQDLAKSIFAAYLQMIKMGGSTKAITAFAKSMGINLAELSQIYSGVTAATDKATAAMGRQFKMLPGMSDGINDVTASNNAYSKSAKEAAKATEANTKAAQAFKKGMDALAADGVVASTRNIKGLTNALQELTLHWQTNLEILFEDYDTFGQNIATASAGIEKLLYFKIDLDTTSADEQIGKSIKSMYDWLAKLDPASQAFKDASTDLFGLTQQFLAIGGVLPQQIVDWYNMELAIRGVTTAVEEATLSLGELDSKFQLGMKTLSEVIAEIARLQDYYGSIYNDELREQLENQIALTLKLFSQIPVGSKAFDELGKALYEAYLQYVAMGGSAEDFEQLLIPLGLKLEDLRLLYAKLTENTNELILAWEDSFNKLFESKTNDCI